MIVRRATPNDVPMLAELFLEMFLHYDPDGSPQKDLFDHRLRTWFDTKTDTVLFVAEDDGTILGHASAAPLFPSGGGQTSLFIKDVFVSDKARGRGIGEALVRECAAEAKRRGAPRLELTVDHDNDGAIRLYQRLGARDTNKTYLRWDENSLADLAEGQS